MIDARALWITGPGTVALRDEAVVPAAGDVLVETLFSGISRGTEALVLRGGVPRRRARPHARAAPGRRLPLSGQVRLRRRRPRRSTGPPDLAGRTVFVLHPHQDRFAAPAAMAVPRPDGRAAGAGRPRRQHGDRAQRRLGRRRRARRPDRRRRRRHRRGARRLALRPPARRRGHPRRHRPRPRRPRRRPRLRLRRARGAPADCDLVDPRQRLGGGPRHRARRGRARRRRSSRRAGTATAPSPLALGGAFHSRRLRLVVEPGRAGAAARRARWTNRRRLEAALALLADPALDALISGETAFADLPARYAAILDRPGTLCHRVRYR